MPSKSDQREIKVSVKVSEQLPSRQMFFNRFRVVREQGYKIIHFGLHAEEGLLDHFSCAMTNKGLDENRDSVLDYLRRNGQPSDKSAPWSKNMPPGDVRVVDVINIHRLLNYLHRRLIGSIRRLPIFSAVPKQ